MIIFEKDLFKGFEIQIKEWDEPSVRVFNGKMIKGRPTKGYGESEFSYAGKNYSPEPWSGGIAQLKVATEAWAEEKLKRKIKFTFCLVGLYETGDACIPHHSDTVPTQKDVVLGVSYGAPRILEWRQYNQEIKKKTNTSKVHLDGFFLKHKTKRFLVEDGDVYLFDGKSQMSSTHSIPSLEGAGERISLTFRSGI